MQQRGRPARATRSREELARALVRTLGVARQEAGLTRPRLAELSGVSVHTIAKIEQSAVTDPGFTVVAALAGVLGISLDLLHRRAKDSASSAGVSRSTDFTAETESAP
ncbi:helix-turn-helix domain-containing protein [Mycolicibacterium arenosum]|uniref:Helix-turn-helix domain-containing protein n=1 Tax=Mycolicibacterium arenosum TaxID=2952157 RepID=A0ABT1LXA4_9MYCO|nr:helix-turn-helix transcriptional regulator [Mycolicibacterium sp. CAU 1645]MCP9271235.1 helix-turn-helix domain-containing protein [Mycolicibacterium sp. CAU 1645]